MALQKPDGGIRPILCGEVWRRCFESLAVNATPIRKEAAKLFTSTYDNFIQTADIRDGASHCAKILSVFYDVRYHRINSDQMALDMTFLNSDQMALDISIKNITIGMSNAFSTCRALR